MISGDHIGRKAFRQRLPSHPDVRALGRDLQPEHHWGSLGPQDLGQASSGVERRAQRVLESLRSTIRSCAKAAFSNISSSCFIHSGPTLESPPSVAPFMRKAVSSHMLFPCPVHCSRPGSAAPLGFPVSHHWSHWAVPGWSQACTSMGCTHRRHLARAQESKCYR